jgi:hypothetical protein
MVTEEREEAINQWLVCGLDEKRYRQALRDQKLYDPRLAGHAHGARWVVTSTQTL